MARIRCTLLAGAIALIGASACSPIEHRAGNLPSPSQVAEIKVGVTTKDEVASILGTPSTTGTFDGDVWYYISKYSETVAFFRPEVIDQQVLVIKFNETDRVSEVQHLTMEDAHQVQMVERTTPTAGHELSVVEQLLGNLGRFGGGSGGPRGGF